MNTSVYITPSEIISKAAAMVGDREFKVLPEGFYNGLIQSAFEELAIATFFQELRADFDFPDGLVHPLPEGCFNVENIYVYNGDKCVIENSHKVWWKRNYFTRGQGYIANNKGNSDPFSREYRFNKDNHGPEQTLFYNIQMGNIMFSPSCRNAGTRVHVHYNGTGCAIGEAPIIPVFLRAAIEDYVIQEALLFRMANDPVNFRMWQNLQVTYERRLDKSGYNGSWHTAKMNVKNMNSSQREELSVYLGRGGWGTGY